MTIVILTWLAVSLTLVYPTAQYLASYRDASIPQVLACYLIGFALSLIWPFALFMLARKAYLTHMLSGINGNGKG